MKKISLITILLLLIATMLKAQSNYRPGYIITNDNDTINGLIDYRIDKANAKVCKFKLTETTKEQSYNPGEITGFRYIEDGKYYVSRDFPIEGKQEMMFWEYLVQGMLSLYYLQKDEVDYYSFEDGSGKVIVAPKHPNVPIIDVKTGKTYLKPDNKYTGIVRYVFKESKSVSKEAGDVKFNHPSMIHLTKKYHDEVCTTGEECIVFETKVDKRYVKTQLSLYAGWQMLSYELTRFGVAHNSSPMIGAQLNFSSPRWQKSLSLQVDISLSQFKGEKQLVDSYIDGYFNRYFKYWAMIAESKLGGKYTYPKEKIRPSAEVGIAFSYFFATSNTYHYETPWQTIHNEDYSQLIAPSRVLGYYAGMGLDYQLKNDHFLLFRISFDNEIHFNRKKAWQLKFGYAF